MAMLAHDERPSMRASLVRMLRKLSACKMPERQWKLRASLVKPTLLLHPHKRGPQMPDESGSFLTAAAKVMKGTIPLPSQSNWEFSPFGG